MRKKQNPNIKVNPEIKKRLDKVDFLEKNMHYQDIISKLLDFYDRYKGKIKNDKRRRIKKNV